MPILKVEIVGTLSDSSADDRVNALAGREAKGFIQALADRAGEVLGARVGGTWVRVYFLPEERYAESGGAPLGVLPVFVSVLQSRGLELSERKEKARALAEVVGKITARPVGNIHILFEPPGKDRIAFGGNLVTD
jgi:hypothetical protein